MTIAITTPTGQIGSRVAKRLLEAGEDILLLARSPEKLSPDLTSNAKVAKGSLLDQEFLANATKSAKALFIVIPPDMQAEDAPAHYAKYAKIAANVVAANKIPYVVTISSFPAHLPAAGFAHCLRQLEVAIDDVAENSLHLRPGYFFENLLHQLPAIQRDGRIYQPFTKNMPMSGICTDDIGDCAAGKLKDLSWHGSNKIELFGPEELTGAAMASAMSKALGRPIEYVEVPEEAARKAWLANGASESITDMFLEMVALFKKHGDNLPHDPAASKERTNTTIETWAMTAVKAATAAKV